MVSALPPSATPFAFNSASCLKPSSTDHFRIAFQFGAPELSRKFVFPGGPSSSFSPAVVVAAVAAAAAAIESVKEESRCVREEEEEDEEEEEEDSKLIARTKKSIKCLKGGTKRLVGFFLFFFGKNWFFKCEFLVSSRPG